MSCPGGSLRLPNAPTSFQPSLYCICIFASVCNCHFLLSQAEFRKRLHLPYNLRFLPTYTASSTTSFPIRQSLKNARGCATLLRSFTRSFLQPAQYRASRPVGPVYSKRTSDHLAHRRLPQDPTSYGYFRVQMVCSNHLHVVDVAPILNRRANLPYPDKM